MVSVTSSAATGDVALLVSPKPGTPGIDWNTLTGGTVSWSTNLLPGGTYGVIAHYEGDTTYGGSYSTPVSVTVNPENSSVYMPGVVSREQTPTGIPCISPPLPTVRSTASLVLPTNLRADVQNAGGNFCTTEALGEIACPTGTMTFTDNGNPLDGGTFKLNSFGYTEDPGSSSPAANTFWSGATAATQAIRRARTARASPSPSTQLRPASATSRLRPRPLPVNLSRSPPRSSPRAMA